MAVRRKLAFGMKQGQVDGNFHWIDVDGTVEPVQPAKRDPLKPSRAILVAIPASLLLWALALGIAGYATLG